MLDANSKFNRSIVATLNTMQTLPPEFCARLGFQPFNLDDEESGGGLDVPLIFDLAESLSSGFDRTRPLVFSQSSKPQLNHLVIDGKNRLTCIYILELCEIKVMPTIVHETIESIDQYHARVAHYILRSKSKNQTLANRLIAENLSQIVMKNQDKGADKLPEYITKCGFSASTISTRVIRSLIKSQSKTKTTPRPPTIDNSEIPMNKDWGQIDTSITTHKQCPNCGETLMIKTSRDGTVLDIQHVITAKK